MSTSTFVEQLYTTILGRASDASGKAFWTALLDNGALGAAEVARGFVESAEFQNRVAPVAMLHYTARGAIPDAAALSALVQQHQGGASLSDLSAALVNSVEFAAVYGALDNSAFLGRLYQNVFHRAPDADGMAFWLRVMEGGASRADVLQGFAGSPEQFAAKGAHLHVIVSYAALVRVAPSQAQIDAAVDAHDTLGMLRMLLSHTDYSGVDVPGLPPRPTTPETPTNPELPTDPETPTTPGTPTDPGTPTTPPATDGATIASAAFDHDNGVLTIQGASFDSLGAAIGTDIKAQLDWSKLVWDINGDDNATANHGFALGDVVSAVITSATQLTVTLSGGVVALVALADFGAAGGADAIDVQAGFLGSQVTTDATSNAAVTFTDTTAPGVVAFTSSTPDGAYCAGATIAISATMSEAVAAGSTLTITLDTGAVVVLTAGAAGTVLTGSYVVAPGQATTALAVSSFAAGTVRDAVGNVLSSTVLPSGSGNLNGTSAIVIDTAAPGLSFSAPADDATAVSVTGNLVLTFTETVTAVPGKQIRIYAASGDTLIETIAAGSAQVGIAGNVVTINPAASLSALTAYYVLLDAGAFADTAGNAYAGIASNSALQFTTAGGNFTASVVASTVEFGGNATGPVVMTSDGTTVTFTRGGIAAPALAIADIGIGGIDAVRMDSATFATPGVASLIKDGGASIDATGSTSPQVIALVAGVNKIADGGITNAILDSSAFAALADKLAIGGALQVNASGATPGDLSELLDNADKVANGGISNASLTELQFATLVAKLAPGGAIAVDTDGAIAGDWALLLANLAKVANGAIVNADISAAEFLLVAAKLDTAGAVRVDAGGASAGELAAFVTDLTKLANGAIVDATLTHTQFAALSAKLAADGAVAVDASGASAAEVTALIGELAKIDDGAVRNAVLDYPQFAALSAKLAAGGAVTLDVSAANAVQLTALGGDPAKVADGAIVNATLTMAQFDDLSDKLAVNGAVSVDVAGASTAELNTVAGAIGKVAAGGIVSAALTASQSDADIAALLTKTSGAVVDASSMTDVQISALAGGASGVAVNGITGSLALTGNALSAGEIGALLGSALSASATVVLDAAGIVDTTLNAVLLGIAKVDTINNLVITNDLGDADIAVVLAKAVDAAVDVTFMNESKLAAVDTAHVRASGVTGAVTGMDAVDVTELLTLASHIDDGVLTGNLIVAHADLAGFNALQAKLAGSATVTVNGVADNATATITNFVNAAFTGVAAGASGAFDVTGGAGVQTITTGVGNDVIDGGAGDDVLFIGAGNDKVVLGDVNARGVDSVNGFASADVLSFAGGVTYLASAINAAGTLAFDDVVQLAADEAKIASGVADSSVGYAVGFVYAGSTYVYIDGANDGFNRNDDAVVKLVGVNVSDLNGASFVA